MEKQMRYPDQRASSKAVRLSRPFRVKRLADGTAPVGELVKTPLILAANKAGKVALAMAAPTRLRPRSPGVFQKPDVEVAP